MLLTCSNDTFAKLLNPHTLQPYRQYEFLKPCRGAAISPLFDSEDCQKFHMMLVGGQDARDVTTTKAAEGGFAIKLMSIIHGDKLAEITGHYGTVHSVAFTPDGTCFATGAEDGWVHHHMFMPEYFTKKFE